MNDKGTPLNLHEKLIKECRAGNRKAQFEIYNLYYRAMYNTSLRIVNNEQDAEDIMQESFLNAFRKIASYEGNVSFGAWLKRIVINKSVDHLRKRKIDFLNIETVNEKTAITTEDEEKWEIEDQVRVKDIITRIQQLPEGYKVILSLYLIEGYDHEEIAGILNISPSTSRTQFMRAKRKLIESLNKKEKNEKN